MSGSLPIGCFFELQTKPERQYLLSSPPFVDAQSPTVASGEWGQSCQRLLFLEDAVRSCRGPTARCTPVSPLKIQLEEGEHPSSGEEDPGAGAALGSGHASSEPAARPIPRFVPIPGFAPGTLKPPTPPNLAPGGCPDSGGRQATNPEDHAVLLAPPRTCAGAARRQSTTCVAARCIVPEDTPRAWSSRFLAV